MMRNHPYRSYRIIGVLFWSFPYLMWQAFGHWSGFVVGVIMAVVLTIMLNNLFHTITWNKASVVEQPSLHVEKSYQRGYRAEQASYRQEAPLYQKETTGQQYEEMQVPYPEMPPPL